MFLVCVPPSLSMFKSVTKKVLPPSSNPSQLNYGVAITDVDGAEGYEVVVAGYDGPNLVLKWNNLTGQLDNIAVNDPSSPYYNIRDVSGQAIGVTACDVDGDGREEIYFLNTNSAYSGRASYPDKLFKWRNGSFEDIFSDTVNKNVSSYSAGRSVGCIDRLGTGRYGIYLANYASGGEGAHDIIEMDPSRSDLEAGVIALRSVGQEVGVRKFTGGRGVTIGPIISNLSDIFCDNERGPNFLFQNQGDGTFRDRAQDTNIEDLYENGRGVALSDFNDDGRIDIVYGNWNGPHRLYIQKGDNNSPKFENIAENTTFATPSPIRTVIAADFNNDGNQEIFLNNIAYKGNAGNSLHTVTKRSGLDPLITEVDIGDALEADGKGTGGAVVDLDGDGKLELIISHGESGKQPLTVYKVIGQETEDDTSNWLRVVVLTVSGGAARGAKVSVTYTSGNIQTRIIDSGSGYLCQMEPVAHFGLGKDAAERVEVLFTDGSIKTTELNSTKNEVITVKQDKNNIRKGKRLSGVSELNYPNVVVDQCSFVNRYHSDDIWNCDKFKTMGFCSKATKHHSWMLFNCKKSCLC